MSSGKFGVVVVGAGLAARCFSLLHGSGVLLFHRPAGAGIIEDLPVIACPLLAAAVMALLLKDGPAGHWCCNAFVALAVSSVVATMATLAGDLPLRGSEGQRLFV